ncbi:MAG: hypothetical protein B5766_06140 [Candidatus Lumbricidophila eiseniae]|uniref:Uncharacterized protein n=1 Tax=Candidatus Lumbricidiphila eiseniae TaxID=1969409 RepID=A0A2A6FRA0_9MICO|nr:MAG: hypothetical protein B5766_06140 [Candidatus Lumbricidophila eiseniae]
MATASRQLDHQKRARPPPTVLNRGYLRGNRRHAGARIRRSSTEVRSCSVDLPRHRRPRLTQHRSDLPDRPPGIYSPTPSPI